MKTGTYGWKSVFAFTFRQTAKSKAFKVSSVIIIALVFAIALLNIISLRLGLLGT